MKSIFCSKCGAKNSKGASFCGNCGEKISLVAIEKNSCPGCGYVTAEDEKYCPECGTALMSGNELEKTPKSQPKPARKKKSRPAAKTTRASLVKKKKGGIVRTLGKVALWIFGIVVLGVVALYFIGDNIDSPNVPESATSTLADITFNPGPVIGSGTKAFEIEPVHGVVLSADENALDKPRDFTVSILEDQELYSHMDMLPANNIIPLVGLDIDSGMQPDEQFPGVMTVSVDLDAYNIDSAMHSDLQVVRTEDDGSSLFIMSEVDGNSITFTTSKNSLFQVVVAVAIGFSGYATAKNNQEKYGGKFGGNHDYTYSNDIKGYTILWSNDQPVGNPTEVDKYQTQLIQILKNNGLSEEKIKSMSGEQIKNSLQFLYNDINYERINKVISNKEWKRNNLYPKEIKLLMDLLEIADNYLFKVRKFKQQDAVDIVVLKEWTGNHDEMGTSRNPTMLSPYVQLNMDYIKDPEFLQTLTHEIFHVSQVRYLSLISPDRDAYVWFWEATAVALESECIDYYSKDEKAKAYCTNTSHPLIGLDNATFAQKSFNYVDGYTDMNDVMHQGYFYEYLIEYLRDTYSDDLNIKKEDFLEALLNRFADEKDPYKTLYKSVVKYPYQFEPIYKQFCLDHINVIATGSETDINKVSPITLSKKNPIRSVDINQEKMSTLVNRLIIEDVFDPKQVHVILRMNPGTITLVDDFAMAYYDWTSNEAVQIKEPRVKTGKCEMTLPSHALSYSKKEPNQLKAYIQEIHYAIEDKLKEKEFQVLAMYKPTVPAVTISQVNENRATLKVTIKPSQLVASNLVDAYHIQLIEPSGKAYEFKTKLTSLDFLVSYNNEGPYLSSITEKAGIYDLNEIKIGLSSLPDNSFTVGYAEITNTESRREGPLSTFVSQKVAEKQVNVTLTADELSIEPGNSVTFEVGPYKSSYKYVWDFGDGSDSFEGETYEYHRFSDVGSYSVKVAVYNGTKLVGSNQVTIQIDENTSGGSIGEILGTWEMRVNSAGETYYYSVIVSGNTVAVHYDDWILTFHGTASFDKRDSVMEANEYRLDYTSVSAIYPDGSVPNENVDVIGYISMIYRDNSGRLRVIKNSSNSAGNQFAASAITLYRK